MVLFHPYLVADPNSDYIKEQDAFIACLGHSWILGFK